MLPLRRDDRRGAADQAPFLQRGGVPVPLPRFRVPLVAGGCIGASEGESTNLEMMFSTVATLWRSTVPDSDPEMVAMLARAAESVWARWILHHVPNPQGLTIFSGWPALVLRAPPRCLSSRKWHDELTGTWTAPFTARNRSSGSSSLATLDGGAARGYTGPAMERSVAMHCVQGPASTWCGNPLLPSPGL